MITGSDDDPFPNTLDANICMLTSVDGKQDDVVTSNSCMHTPLLHLEAGIVSEPQVIPLVEAEYVIVYVELELSIVPPIVALVEVY